MFTPHIRAVFVCASLAIALFGLGAVLPLAASPAEAAAIRGSGPARLTPARPVQPGLTVSGRPRRATGDARGLRGRKFGYGYGRRYGYGYGWGGWGFGGGRVIIDRTILTAPAPIDPARGSAVQPGAMGNVTRAPGTPVIHQIARRGDGLRPCAIEPRRQAQVVSGQPRARRAAARDAGPVDAPFVTVRMC